MVGYLAGPPMAGPRARSVRGKRVRVAAYVLGDPLAVALGVLLGGIGVFSVYASGQGDVPKDVSSAKALLTRQLITLAVAVGIGVAVSAAGHRTVRRLAWPAFAAVSLALTLVLSPLGARVNGARAWFSFGPVQIEPSQLAILVLVVLLAAWLDNPAFAPRDQSLRLGQLPIPLAAVGFLTALVLAEPALGMAFVVVTVGAAMLAVAGLRRRTLAVLVLAVGLAGGATAGLHLIQPYQQKRLTAFINPQPNTAAGYQTQQSVIAVGGGGLTGQGLLRGSQTNGQFVPEQRTDFVFTVVAEETGFMGGATLLILITGLCLRALTLARKALDRYSQLLAAGIAAWLAFQMFVNVGMTLGIMPVSGIPLPFISYGGSSSIVDFSAIGLLASIAREQRRRPRRRLYY